VPHTSCILGRDPSGVIPLWICKPAVPLLIEVGSDEVCLTVVPIQAVRVIADGLCFHIGD